MSKQNQMKHLTTIFTLLLSCTTLAQGPVEFPWNPDSDGDDFIGVNDLMALLGAFDSVFSEEALYLSEDSLSAMYDAGTMNYVECQLECSTLPGQWKMPRLNEVQVANQAMWIETSQREVLHTGSYFNVKYLTPEGRLDDEDLSYIRACFCVTKERPKVEYSFCNVRTETDNVTPYDNDNVIAFQNCCNSKVQDGWYPLGGMSKGHWDGAGQAFWRWAE